MTVNTRLRLLVGDYKTNGGKLHPLSRRANISYHRLMRWWRRETPSMDMDTAERVFKELTGRSFTSPAPVVRGKEEVDA